MNHNGAWFELHVCCMHMHGGGGGGGGILAFVGNIHMETVYTVHNNSFSF